MQCMPWTWRGILLLSKILFYPVDCIIQQLQCNPCGQQKFNKSFAIDGLRMCLTTWGKWFLQRRTFLLASWIHFSCATRNSCYVALTKSTKPHLLEHTFCHCSTHFIQTWQKPKKTSWFICPLFQKSPILVLFLLNSRFHFIILTPKYLYKCCNSPIKSP